MVGHCAAWRTRPRAWPSGANWQTRAGPHTSRPSSCPAHRRPHRRATPVAAVVRRRLKLPARCFGREAGKAALVAHAVGGQVENPRRKWCGSRVCPVQGAVVRAPGQAVGGGGGHTRFDPAGARSVARRPRGSPRNRARHCAPPGSHRSVPIQKRPSASHLPSLARRCLRIVVERDDGLQHPPPLARSKDTMAQRHHQAAAGGGCDAAGLTGHVPALNGARAGLVAQRFGAPAISNPVKPLLVRMPKGRFAQQAGL